MVVVCNWNRFAAFIQCLEKAHIHGLSVRNLLCCVLLVLRSMVPRTRTKSNRDFSARAAMPCGGAALPYSQKTKERMHRHTAESQQNDSLGLSEKARAWPE